MSFKSIHAPDLGLGVSSAKKEHGDYHEALIRRQLFLHFILRYVLAMRFPGLLLACLTVPMISAHAGETAWQEVAPGVQLRLIGSGVIKDGRSLLGLEFHMPDTTKTYWRIPGETGLAPDFDFSASTGIEGSTVVWPHPEILNDGYTDFVYYGDTVLPIEVDANGPAPVAALSAFLGICSDICMPVEVSFSLPLVDARPDRPNALRIKQALSEAPIPWADGMDPLGQVRLDPGANALAVEVQSDAIDLSSLVVTTASGTPLLGAPQKSQQDNLVLLPILGKTKNSALEGQEVQLSFMTGMGAFELRRTVVVGQGPN
jgi:DsbC/DsbD-like thiol-disulfide interchange protein